MEEASKARIFIKQIEYEESQTREVMFYKDVVKRNVSASQLESMLATYKAEKDVPKQGFPQQLQLPSPESSQHQQSRPSIQSKSVSWSVGNAGYGYGYGPTAGTAESRGVVNAGSVVASAAGHGLASNQGVG